MTQKTQMIGIGLRKGRHIYWSGSREGSMDVLGKGGFGKMAASAAAPPGTAGPGKHSHLHFQPIYTHSPTYFHSNPCAFTLEQSHLHFTWPREEDIVILWSLKWGSRPFQSVGVSSDTSMGAEMRRSPSWPMRWFGEKHLIVSCTLYSMNCKLWHGGNEDELRHPVDHHYCQNLDILVRGSFQWRWHVVKWKDGQLGIDRLSEIQSEEKSDNLQLEAQQQFFFPILTKRSPKGN